MPCRSHRLISGPYGLVKRCPSSACAIAAFSSRLLIGRLVKLCALSRRHRLRGVDDVDRRFARGKQSFRSLRKRRLRVLVFQRHGPLGRTNRDGCKTIEAGELLLEETHVAKRRGHQ